MEKKLNEYGIYPDPPINVSNRIVEQVLKGRSGRLVVPKSEERKTGLRNWPRWVQDLLFGNVWRNEKRFAFGKEDTKLIA